MFRKYATATVISAEIAERNAVGLVKAAHRAVFDYEPKPGFLYVRSRMISSRCNDNHDEFPAEEIRKAWKTAVGKPVFVNHHNEDHRRMRGVIIDAALHEDTLPDGSPDIWIEALHEIDARRFPKLAQAILSGRVNRTSMGTDVGFSICSACGNKASTPAEYCQHIPQMKGKVLYRHTASGQREGQVIREICYKLGFFENSFLVEDPADPTAVVTGVDDRGLKATASKAASARTNKDGFTPGEVLSWDAIGERHPHLYGDEEVHGEAAEGADGEGIGWAASHLAHSRPEDPEAEDKGSWDLDFHSEEVDPKHIDYFRNGSHDSRVIQARQGYLDHPSKVPPLVLVHRHGVYQVADGHHRAEAAASAGRKVRAYVAYSPHPDEPDGEGDRAPYNGAEPHPGKKPPALSSKATRKTAVPKGMQFTYNEPNDFIDAHQLSVTFKAGNGRRVKGGTMWWHPDDGKVINIQVSRKHQGKGIGSALWQRAHEVASQRGIPAPMHSDVQTPQGKDWAKSVDERGLPSMPGPGQTELFDIPAEHKTRINPTGSSLPKVADYHVWCDREGCDDAHWGPDGAAGLLIRHKGEDGQHRYLLQKRSPWVDHGNTWGIPGGALHEDESPEEGAHREGREEMGEMPTLRHHRTHIDDHGGWAYHTVIMDADEQFHPGDWDEESTGHAWFTKPEMKNLDLHPGFAQSLHQVTEGDGMQTQSSLPSIEIEAVRYDKPEDHPFFKEDVSLHPRHIIAAYDEADEPTRAQGLRWYSDGHHVAKALDPDGDAHRGAGVLAAYSPRSNWPINLFNASRSLQQRRAVRIGEGMNVMGNHAKSAAKILEDGKHYLQAFTTPKITDFAHLLAHGGDDEDCAHCEPHKKPDHPQQAVVVDRHALSAAAGRRMTDNDLGRAPLGTRKFYEHVADQYRKAASEISLRDGTTVHPHQLQAITWLQQQKRNAAQEASEAATDPKAKGRLTRERNAWQAWEEHSRKHHPEFQSGDEANMHLRNPHKHSSLPTVAFRKGAPFAGYDDFEDCTEKNSDKDDASAYCGEIKKRTEGSHDGVQGVREGVRAGAGTSGAEANSLPRMQTAQQAREAHAGGSQAARRAGERADQGRSVAARGVRPQGVLAAEAPGDREAGRSVRGMRDDELAGAVDQSRGRANGHGGHQAVARAVQGSAGGGAGVRSALPELSAPLGVQQGSDQAAGLGRVQASARAGVSGEVKHRTEGSRSSLPTLAYNETRAPADVDTLRTESCPVCGETDSFDGDRCQVCNFIQPPAMFTDPDTGVARQMDLKKDQFDQGMVAPDGQPIEGIPDGSGDPNLPNGQDPAMQGLPGMAEDTIADLFCPACGFSADTQQPMTNNDPSMASEQQGLLAGDVCPNCGQATMLSPNDVGMLGGEVPQEVADDANANGIPDAMEGPDSDMDGTPDEEDPDADGDGLPDGGGDGVPDGAGVPGDAAPAEAGPDDEQPEDEADDGGDAVEDEDEAPKGRKDNTRRAVRRG